MQSTHEYIRLKVGLLRCIDIFAKFLAGVFGFFDKKQNRNASPEY
jgi:hypothetical protein